MKVLEIIPLRLRNQQLASTSFNTAKELVGWMGAIQAQDYNLVETEYFRPHNKIEERLIAEAAKSYGNFSEKNAEIEFTEKPP